MCVSGERGMVLVRPTEAGTGNPDSQERPCLICALPLLPLHAFLPSSWWAEA